MKKIINMKNLLFISLILFTFSCQKPDIANPEYHLQCAKEDGPRYFWQLIKLVEDGNKITLDECEKAKQLCLEDDDDFYFGSLNVEGCYYGNLGRGSWFVNADTLIMIYEDTLINEVKSIITFQTEKKFELEEVGRDKISTYKLRRG